MACLFQHNWNSFIQKPTASGVALYVLGLYAWLSLFCWSIHRRRQHPPWFGGGAWSTKCLQFSKGTLISALGLLSLGFIFWATGSLENLQAPALSHAQIVVLSLKIIAMALAMAGIEEMLFRGLSLDLLQEDFSAHSALLWQALLFALLHLLRGDLHWASWLTAFIGLSLTGIALAQFRLQHNSLWSALGLHATWIGICVGCERLQLLQWNAQHSLWTGQGNPAYGISGVLFLSALVYLNLQRQGSKVSD